MRYALHPGSQRFLKSERLSSKKLITELFRKGKTKRYRNIKFIYLPVSRDTSDLHQVLFSVPARIFKKAVHRNRIKRQLRECYRKNKGILYGNGPVLLPYLMAYVYISSNLPLYAELEKQVIASFDNLKTTDTHNHEKKA